MMVARCRRRSRAALAINRITGKDVGPFCKGLVGSDDCSRSRALEQIGATTALAQLDQLAQRAAAEQLSYTDTLFGVLSLIYSGFSF
jgi:hypothetical protein